MGIIRVAMWSGPRNLSTALMRSFGNRRDTQVVDEPFYAHYLQTTGLEHPGRDEVLAAHECDWRKVAAALHAPLPAGIGVHYQKHMAHHLLPTMGREWLAGLTHAFLLRDPADMLRSLGRKLTAIRLEDTGLPQQLEIFERLRAETGVTPPVIDADDLLADPEGLLRTLCAALGIEFQSNMLRWPLGRRDTDGIWAKHWYESVERSSGFERWQRSDEPLPAALADVERAARPLYAAMHGARLRPVARGASNTPKMAEDTPSAATVQ
jgi:hypothetical protein